MSYTTIENLPIKEMESWRLFSAVSANRIYAAYPEIGEKRLSHRVVIKPEEDGFWKEIRDMADDLESGKLKPKQMAKWLRENVDRLAINANLHRKALDDGREAGAAEAWNSMRSFVAVRGRM